MSTCAVVQNRFVINLIVAEPTDTPPDSCILVLIPDNVFVTLGYTYIDPYFYDFEGNQLLPIKLPVEETPTEESPIGVIDGS